MKKVVLILLAILMVTSLTVGFAACKTDCDKGIHDKYVASETAATCTADKVQHWACNNCDWTEDVTVEGSALGHDYTGVAWTPSATDETKHQRACTRSGCNYVDTAAHVANSDGTACKDCNKPMGTPACQHDYTGVKWTPSTTDPTKHQRKCTKCEYVDVADHTSTTVKGTPATCTAAGREDGTKCSFCDKVLTEGAVISALGHDYTGANWTPCSDDATKHQRTCGHDGCGVVEKAAHGSVTVEGKPATCTEDGKRNGTKCPDCNKVLVEGEVIPARGHQFATAWTHEGDKHFHKCERDGCTARDSVADCNYEYSASQKNETQHWGVCSVCKGASAPVNHDSNKVLPAVEVKCYADGLTEGKACSVCGQVMVAQQTVSKDTVKHSWVWVYGDDRDASLSEFDHYQKCSVEGCTAVTNKGSHTLLINQGDESQHWNACQCGYVDASSKHAHVWGDGEQSFVCTECKRVAADVYLAVVIEGDSTVHRLGEQGTLQQAVDLVGAGKTATIYMGRNLSGSGVVVPSGRNITFRFNNHTYTVTGNLVGSTGTETNGFQLLKDSTLTFINGTIKVASDVKANIIVQNYANLTLDHVTLDASDAPSVNYALSNNCGNVVIDNDSKITAATGKVAFDAYYNLNGDYPNGVTVTVKSGCLITGIIEYGAHKAHATDGWQQKTVISLPNEDKNYNIRFGSGLGITCDSASVTINGQKLSHKEDAGVITKQANCHEKGVKTFSCTVCGKVLRTEEIEMTAHSWNGGVVTTPQTCTAGGVKTFTCTADGCGATKTEDLDALGHDWQTKWSFDIATKKHWHACNRCTEKQDEASCTEVTKKGTPATCTEGGVGDGVECSVCHSTIVAGAKINVLGHDMKCRSISLTQHQEYCDRDGCSYTKTAVNHAYGVGKDVVPNHCAACGKDITEAELRSLIESELKKDGDVLLSKDNIYTLTGFYGGLGDYQKNYKLLDENGNEIIICYELDITDLIVGDKIAVTGPIKQYKATKEFASCTYTAVKLGSCEITISFNATHIDSMQLTDKEGNVIAAVDGKYMVERRSDVYVTVTAKTGFAVDGITLNGDELVFADGKYTFKVSTENALEIQSRSLNTLPDHNASGSEVTLEITNSQELKIGTDGNSYSGENVSGTKTVNGVEYSWNKVASNNYTNFQMNGNPNKTGAGGYLKIKVPANITSLEITIATITNYGRMLVNGTVATGSKIALGDNIREITITSNDSIKITKIVIKYNNAVVCTNSQSPKHFDGNPSTCTADGNKEYWQCLDCNKYFIKNDVGKYVEVALSDTVIKAGHTPIDTEWQHGKATVEGKEVFAHWHACENCNEKLDLVACVGTVKADTAHDATCTEAGKHADKVCEDCGQTVEVGATIPALGHDYDYTPNENGTHDGICTRCEDIVESVPCTAADANSYGKNDTHHWNLCVCGNEVNKTEHIYDAANENKCVCGAQQGVTLVEAEIKWSVKLNGEANYWADADKIKTAVSGYTAKKYVGETIAFSVSDIYRVESLTVATGDDLPDVVPNAAGEYSFEVKGATEIEVILVRQYTVAVDTASAQGITVTAKVGEQTYDLPAKFDDGTNVQLVVNMGDLAATKIIKTATYKIDGGTDNAITIGADKISLTGTIPVTGDVSICLTLDDKPNETTVTKTTFASGETSGALDDNISYTTAKGDGTTAPTVNNGLRLYKPASGKSTGGYITISVAEGKRISSVAITSSTATSIKYSIAGGSISETALSIDKNGTRTIDITDSANSITIYCTGTERLNIISLSVTYVE